MIHQSLSTIAFSCRVLALGMTFSLVQIQAFPFLPTSRQSNHHYDLSSSQLFVSSTRKISRKRRPSSSNGNNSQSRKKNSRGGKQQQIIQPTTSIPKAKPKSITMEQLNGMSIGQAIQESQTTSHLLHVASTLIWLPTDVDLKPHLKTQAIHAEKRMRSARYVLHT